MIISISVCALVSTASFVRGASQWRLLSREDGCADIELLQKRYGLASAPDTPQDFEKMMQEKGHSVKLGMPEGFGAQFDGRVIEAQIDNDKRPVFLRADLCDALEKKK